MGLPIGLFLFQLWGCPASAVVALDAESCRLVRSSGRFPCTCSRLFSSPLSLRGIVTTLRVCLPQAPALWKVLEAMLAERALESPSILVLAFHSSLSFVEGSFDGLAAGDRFLSWTVVSHSLRSC